MSDVITLANQIAAAKEDIRLAIEGRNVNVPAENPTCRHSTDKNALMAATCSSTRSSTLLSWIFRAS